METMLIGIPGVQAYLDDVLVAERKEDGGNGLNSVLQCFRENGVKLRKDKCTFWMPEVYLGHKIGSDRLQPLEKNLDAVMKAPSPKDVSELRSYIGFLTYYSKFLPNMATLLAQLYDLLAKDRCRTWGLKQQKELKKSKQALRQSKMLTYFDLTKLLHLECDGTPYEIGAVLSHSIGSIDKTTEFRSRRL